MLDVVLFAILYPWTPNPIYGWQPNPPVYIGRDACEDSFDRKNIPGTRCVIVQPKVQVR